MGSTVQLVLLATSVGEHGLSPGLLGVGGQPVVNYWLQALRGCSRLLPAVDKVVIVTSPETHGSYVEWASRAELSAGGFPLECLVANPEPGCGSAPLVDVAYALSAVPRLQGSFLLVASLDVFLGPDLPLRLLVEHAVIRGKESVLFTRPPPGQPLQGEAEVLFDLQGTTTVTGEPANPKVADVDVRPSGEADGFNTATLVPVCFLHRDTTATLIQGAGTELPPPGPHQLARFVKELCGERGRPVYGFHVDMCMNVSLRAGHTLARLFGDFYSEQMARKNKRGPAAEALVQVTKSAQDQGCAAYVDPAVERLLARSSEVKQQYLRFSALAPGKLAAIEADAVAKAHAAATGTAMTKYGVRDELPLRFGDVTTQRHEPKKQHPVYQTTSNDIGLKKPTQLDMPDVYAGSACGFTKAFTGPPVNKSLTTGITRSKVHRLLDDF